MLTDLLPVPVLRKAAQQLSKLSSDRRAAKLLRECHRLLSVRAEANSPAIAQGIIAEFGTLTDAELDALFDSIAREFSPDPHAVLTVAQAYAADPTAGALATLSAAAEPPRPTLCRGSREAKRRWSTAGSNPTCLNGSTQRTTRCTRQPTAIWQSSETQTHRKRLMTTPTSRCLRWQALIWFTNHPKNRAIP